MTTLQDKFNKLYSARAKLEAELNNIYGEIYNAVDKQDRKVKIERLLVKCKDAFIRVVDKMKSSLIWHKRLKIQMLPVRTLKNG